MQRAVDAFRPTRSRGQCFLQDPRFIDRIVAAVAPKPGETLIEVGAGAGQLTIPMLDAGASLIAIEADRKLSGKLRPRRGHRLELIEADVLKLDLPQLLDDRNLDRVRVYANLPYSVASPILLRLLSHADRFDSLVLMFQKEVAERLVARPSTKDYSVLSVLAQQAADVEMLFKVPPNAFKPRPRVMSAVVQLDLLHDAAADFGNEATFRAMVKALLAHRRKTIANNIKHLGPSALTRTQIQAAVGEMGLDVGRRAETLSVEEFAALARICASAA